MENNIIRPFFWPAGTGQTSRKFNPNEPPLEILVEWWIDSRRRRGVCENYLDNVSSAARKLATAHGRQLSQMTTEWFLTYLRRFESRSPRTRNNHLAIARQIVKYAKVNKWLDPAWSELDAIEKEIEPRQEAQIYTSGEIRRLLDVCLPYMRPLIVLTAFCGVRMAEATRLEWSDIDLERRRLVVGAAKAKTRSRRICPVPENAFDWLTEDAGDGPLCTRTRKTIAWALRHSLERAKIPPHRNGLRRSFISYRLALTNEISQTALEAGTSEAMVFRNYRDLATPEQSEAWFSVRPDRQLSLPLVA